MKLTEPDIRTANRLLRLSPPEAEATPDVEVDAIRVARLPRKDRASVAKPPPEADTAIEISPHPSRPIDSEPAAVVTPPTLMFFTAEAPRTLIKWRPTLLLILVAMAGGFLWVTIDSGTTATSRGLHKSPLRLTAAEQRIEAAGRTRTAAIAQAKRDRGTDAEWEDTIPAPAPPTSAATP